MNTKKLRNLFIVVGILTALFPWFMYYLNGSYYGTFLSLMTTTGAVAAFITAALIQAYDNKKKGLSIWYPLILSAGFIVILIYVWVSN